MEEYAGMLLPISDSVQKNNRDPDGREVVFCTLRITVAQSFVVRVC